MAREASKGSRFTVRIEDVFGLGLESSVRFTADGSQQIGIGRIEVVFVRIGVRQDPRRASALLADRAEKVGALFCERNFAS